MSGLRCQEPEKEGNGWEGNLRKSGSEAVVREKSRCQGRIGRLERASEDWEMRRFHNRTGGSACAKGDRGSQDFERENSRLGGCQDGQVKFVCQV